METLLVSGSWRLKPKTRMKGLFIIRTLTEMVLVNLVRVPGVHRAWPTLGVRSEAIRGMGRGQRPARAESGHLDLRRGYEIAQHFSISEWP